VKALRWHGRGDVRLDEIEPPGPPGPGEVQLAVTACGICGTDVEEWREGPLLIPVGAPHSLTGAVAPLTLGHEVAGEVVAAGAGAGLAVGQAVAVDGLVTCGHCRECRRGRPNLCPEQGQVGLMADGGLQPLVNVPASTCVAVPAQLDAEGAALAETLSVAVRALRRARMEPGDRVGVYGAGAVGLLAVQAARAMGAAHVGVVEPLAGRRALAAGLGADETIDPADLERRPATAPSFGAAAAAAAATAGDGPGYDVVVECSGVPAAVLGAIAGARRAGRIALVGINRSQPPLDTWGVVAAEKEIVGSFSHVRDQDFAGALGLLAGGAVVHDGMVTRVPLARSLDGGLLALAEHPERYLKIIVVPDDPDHEAAPR
jgi:(R,R)-butanediol dehydrogenase/meso-butanediol dehydrogenase/diacetyl reductase